MVIIISGILPEERDDLRKYGQIIQEKRTARFVLLSKSKRLGRKHWKNKKERCRYRGGGR